MAYAGAILTYAYYAVVIAAAIYSVYMMSKGAAGPDDLAPNSLNDFNITRAEEGSVAPLVYGRAKITGNIMWYGNFETEPIVEKVDSGKKSQEVITGYNYYLDVWQALGHGQMTILDTWIDGENKNTKASATIYNDGTQTTHPTQPGQYANAMKGIATIFFDRLFLGENVMTLPTIHWLVERLLTSGECPLTYRNITGYGVNPAAIVWDLLRRGGASTSDIDTTSFQAAATYWYNKNYGLNIVFSRRAETREAIKTVLKYVGAAFGRDKNNKFFLKALDEADASVKTLSYDDGDFITFRFQRQSWDQCNTDFVGTYRDEDQEYTERTVKAYNPAVTRILGRTKPAGIDLKGFRTTAIASERIWEIMKEQTYPFAQVQCDVPIRHHDLLMGEVVTVNHSKYGISNAEFRVMQKDYKSKDRNEITLLLRQNTEKLWDSNYRSAGGTAWVSPDYTPSAPYAQKVFQLPYNHVTGEAVTYLLLVARAHTYELGYTLYRSITGSDYAAVGIRRSFAQYGTLDEAYPVTIEIDEDVGITYTPYLEDPAFDTINFVDALQGVRLALIGEELIGFATVTLNPDDSITLTDCIRGMFGTVIAAHSASDPIWLFPMNSEYTLADSTSTFYLKFVPYGLHSVVDIGDCSAATVTRDVPTIISARTGDYANTTVLAPMVRWDRTGQTLLVLPRYKDGAGAGFVSEEFIDTALPTTLPSNIKVWWRGSSAGAFTETTTYLTNLGGTYSAMYCYIEIDGRASPTVQFPSYITYGNIMWHPWSPDQDDTLIMKLMYAAEHWSYIMDYNNPIIEEKMKISNFNDVDVTGLAVDDRLMWDTTIGKWTVVEPEVFTQAQFDCTVFTQVSGKVAYAAYISTNDQVGNTTADGAFDGGENTYYPWWRTSEHNPWTADTVWWQLNMLGAFGEATKVTCIRMKPLYDSATDRWPREIKVVVSDTGAFSGEEVTVFDGEIKDITSLTPATWSAWTPFTNPTRANYLRIWVQSVYTYDPGGYWMDVDEWEFMTEADWPYVKGMAVTAGVTDAQFIVLDSDDDNVITIEGINATPAFDVDFTFKDVTVANFYVKIKGRYEGDEAHIARLQVWNNNTAQFDYITAAATDFEHRTDEGLYVFGPINSGDYVDGSNEVKVKIVHESAGDDSDVFIADQMMLLGTSTTTTSTTTTT